MPRALRRQRDCSIGRAILIAATSIIQRRAGHGTLIDKRLQASLPNRCDLRHRGLGSGLPVHRVDVFRETRIQSIEIEYRQGSNPRPDTPGDSTRGLKVKRRRIEGRSRSR